MDGEEKKRIKIESEKWEKNLENANKSHENHGISGLKVEFSSMLKNLHSIRTFNFHGRKSWLEGEKKTGSEKNPRQHERKNVSFQFSRSTYTRMEGIVVVVLTKLATQDGWGGIQSRGKIMCLTNKEIRTLHRIKQVFKGLCEFFLI